VRQEQEERKLVLIKVGGPRKIGERRRLIGGTRRPWLDEMIACAPAFRNLSAVISIRSSGWSDDRDRAAPGGNRIDGLIFPRVPLLPINQ
jgi:hypothetical protein